MKTLEESKLENWQKEILGIRKTFNDMLDFYCDIVQKKTNNLIKSRGEVNVKLD